MHNILYSVAYNAAGEWVKAADATTGERYQCPGCTGDMVPRRSTVKKKGSKRPHFAHLVTTENCRPETVLHSTFKRLLAERVQRHISNGTPLHFAWRCEHCSEAHKGDLIKKARSVREEMSLGPCRPDVVLLNEQDKPVWALEVVVTHAPEAQVIEYYKTHGIALATFELTSDLDLEKVEQPRLLPTQVDQCTNPRCKLCKRLTYRQDLWVIDGPCYKCARTIKIATVQSQAEEEEQSFNPEEFTANEIELAAEHGCQLKVKYSHTRRERYLANTCPHCGAMAGDFHLYSNYIAPAMAGELPVRKVPLGFFCVKCDIERMTEARKWEVEKRRREQHKQEIARAQWVAEQPKNGYCIRCRAAIRTDRYRPLCTACFPHEMRREGTGEIVPVGWTYCHACGEGAAATRRKPYCQSCMAGQA